MSARAATASATLSTIVLAATWLAVEGGHTLGVAVFAVCQLVVGAIAAKLGREAR